MRRLRRNLPLPPAPEPQPEIGPEKAPEAASEPVAGDVAPLTRARCNTLLPFDSNQDGQITGADRYWRHLYLWVDDGDGAIEAKETERVFDYDIREISLNLDRYEAKGDVVGEITHDRGVIRFRLYSRSRRSRGGPEFAVLAVDVDGVMRGEGATFCLGHR